MLTEHAPPEPGRRYVRGRTGGASGGPSGPPSASANARNVPFYERLGFRVAEIGTVPGSDLRTWAMRRG